MTESEDLFESFCVDQSLIYERIQESGDKSPDYWVTIADSRILVEVKQIEPNREEREMLNTPLDEWDPVNVYHWGLPGERIRKKISDAMPQLKSLSKGILPTLLVVFDAIKFWPELTDQNAVKVAMYGIETILISSEVAPEGGAKIIRKWHGSRRRLTQEHNTTLSAVGIIAKGDNGISFDLYHNFYASLPLPRNELARYGIKQFYLCKAPFDAFPDWEETRPNHGMHTDAG